MEELKMEQQYEPALKGIGGWLIYFAIGIVLSPIQLLRSMSDLSELKEYVKLVDMDGFPMIYFTLFDSHNILALLLSCLMFYMFFAKKKMFINLVIIELVITTVFFIGMIIILSGFSGIMGEFLLYGFVGLIGGLIKIAYFKSSERVANTFVN